MSRKRKEKRRQVTCWLRWSFDENTNGIIELIYWRRVIFTEKVGESLMEGVNIAACWWAAEDRAKTWARKKGFEIIKERLTQKNGRKVKV